MKHVCGEEQFLLCLSCASSMPQCLMDSETYRAGAPRTEGQGSHPCIRVTETKVGFTEGDHRMRRGPITNSGVTAKVNGQISEQETSQ